MVYLSKFKGRKNL